MLTYSLSLQASALLVMPVFVLYTLLTETFGFVFSFLSVQLVLDACFNAMSLQIDFVRHLI